MMRKVYLAKLINDGNWSAIRKDLSIRPVGANIKGNGETVRYVIDGNSDEAGLKSEVAPADEIPLEPVPDPFLISGRFVLPVFDGGLFIFLYRKNGPSALRVCERPGQWRCRCIHLKKPF